MNVTVTFKEYEEMILAKKMVDSIFDEAFSSDYFGGKVSFYVNEYLLQKLFPERYNSIKEKLEKEYKEREENVQM